MLVFIVYSSALEEKAKKEEYELSKFLFYSTTEKMPVFPLISLLKSEYRCVKIITLGLQGPSTHPNSVARNANSRVMGLTS